MTVELLDHEARAREAVKAFWGGRSTATDRALELGLELADNRQAVVGGKNMDGFALLVRDIVVANGLPFASIYTSKGNVTLPGYFRPTKQWDVVVVWRGCLIAAVELKSQVGSLGNNFNNRLEEAVGSGIDLRRAHETGAFGKTAPRPFVGWLMMIGDEPGARRPISDRSRDFGVLPAFAGASYCARYEILCRRLVEERIYNAACFLSSPPTSVADGRYEEHSEMTSLTQFLTALAGHCAAVAES